MSKTAKPFVTHQRGDRKTYQITLNPACGLPSRVCAEWRRRSFQSFPDELAMYRNPKDGNAADAGAFALVMYLKSKLQEEGGARRVTNVDITVGEWVRKFTAIETSPRTGINASKNRSYSIDTLVTYKDYYDTHIKGDPFTKMKMAETEESDAYGFITRMSIRKLKDGRRMGGTRTFVGVLGLVSMAFKEYQRNNRKWINPFQYIDKPIYYMRERDALPEEEMLRLFAPGVLRRPMEVAVCAAIFLSGLRRSEVSALKPEDLDWNTPQINVRRAWQHFEGKDRVLGPPKGKRERKAPFDPVLQAAIKKVWEENGKHEFVFCWKDGRVIGSSWTITNFRRWLERAKIDLAGRDIVPHSARHTLATLLADNDVSLKYIQDLLGHSDLKTTGKYIHLTEKTIRKIGEKISVVMEGQAEKEEPDKKVTNFRAS